MKYSDLRSISQNILLDEVKRRLDNPSILDFEDEELKKALKNRGFYVFDYDPTDEDVDLDEVELSDIVEHLKGHEYMVLTKSELANHISDLPTYELKDLLCDIVGVNHHTSKDDILRLLAEKF